MVVEGWQKNNCILYSVFCITNKVKHFLTKSTLVVSCVVFENFVPLQSRNKDRKRRLGQRKFCFRPARFYCLPSAQKFCPESDKESERT